MRLYLVVAPMIFHRVEWIIYQSIILLWALAQGLSTSASIALGMAFIALNLYLSVRYFRHINWRKLDPLYYIMLAFFIFMCSALFFNWADNEEARRGLSKLKYFLIFLLPYPLLRSIRIPFSYWRPFFRKVLLALASSYLLATIAGLISRFSCFQINQWVASCNDRNPGMTGIMQYAYETPLILLLTIYAGFIDNKLGFSRHQRSFFKALSFIYIFGLLSSNGRGPIVSLVLMSLFIGALFWRQILNGLNIKTGFFYGAIISGLLYFSFSSVIIPLEENRIISSSASMSNDIRMNLNYLSLDAFLTRPITGWGLLHPKREISNEHSKTNNYILQDTHNTHTQVLVDGGILAFVAYLIFFMMLIWLLLKTNGLAQKILVAVWLTFLSIASFHSMLVTGTGTAVLLFLLILFSCLITTNHDQHAKS
jgi:O-antigen ligase